MVDCAKCRKEIAAGQEVVKKRFLGKKSYHLKCAPVEQESNRATILTCPQESDHGRNRARI
jgi:hypothetical protein